MDGFIHVFVNVCDYFFKSYINKSNKKRDYVYNFKVSEKNKQLNYIYRLFYIPQLIREVKTSNLSSFVLGLKSNFDKCTIELIKANIKEKATVTVIK